MTYKEKSILEKIYMPKALKILQGIFWDCEKVVDVTGTDKDKMFACDIEVKSIIGNPISVGFRIRDGIAIADFGDWARWRHQFTIRYQLTQSNNDTEFQKIMAGNAKYLLYGWGIDKQKLTIKPYCLIDLDIFREGIRSGIKETGRIPNDSSDTSPSLFNVYRFKQFPPKLIYKACCLTDYLAFDKEKK